MQEGLPTLAPLSRVIPALVLTLFVSRLSATPLQLSVCYNFGCKTQATAHLAETDLQQLEGMFLQATSAEEERASIRQAIASLEQIVGRQLPTANDVGGNYQQGMADDGQLDCIDESTNTTGYLTFIQQQGLLRWHFVEERAYRAPYLFDQHWAAKIRERNSGRRYVVDSWFEANGKPPLIQPLEDWQRKRSPPGE